MPTMKARIIKIILMIKKVKVVFRSIIFSLYNFLFYTNRVYT